MSEMKVTGIEPVKTNFYLFTINAYGKQAGKIKLSRSNLLNWLVQRPGMTVLTALRIVDTRLSE